MSSGETCCNFQDSSIHYTLYVKKFITMAAFAAAISLGLSSCSDDDDDDEGSSSISTLQADKLSNDEVEDLGRRLVRCGYAEFDYNADGTLASYSYDGDMIFSSDNPTISINYVGWQKDFKFSFNKAGLVSSIKYTAVRGEETLSFTYNYTYNADQQLVSVKTSGYDNDGDLKTSISSLATVEYDNGAISKLVTVSTEKYSTYSYTDTYEYVFGDESVSTITYDNPFRQMTYWISSWLLDDMYLIDLAKVGYFGKGSSVLYCGISGTLTSITKIGSNESSDESKNTYRDVFKFNTDGSISSDNGEKYHYDDFSSSDVSDANKSLLVFQSRLETLHANFLSHMPK